jgi:hypothetical protein
MKELAIIVRFQYFGQPAFARGFIAYAQHRGQIRERLGQPERRRGPSTASPLGGLFQAGRLVAGYNAQDLQRNVVRAAPLPGEFYQRRATFARRVICCRIQQFVLAYNSPQSIRA